MGENATTAIVAASLFGALASLAFSINAIARAWVARGNAKLPVRMIGFPYLTILGGALVAAIILTTPWVEGMQPALEAGLPWLAFVSVIYFVWMRKPKAPAIE